VHIRFYDRGVDAKSAPVRDPGTLGDFNDLPMQLLDNLRTECARDLQDGLRVGHVAGIDACKCPIDQVRPDFVLQVVIAPIKQVLQNQHPDDDFGRRSEPPAASTLGPAFLERLGHHFNHGRVLEGGIDSSQPVGPQLVTIGQQNFEQTPLALSALNHARSFDERSCAGRVVRQIDRRNRRFERLVTAGRRPSVQFSDLRGHFFTAK
jgi:hypothetical protein